MADTKIPQINPGIAEVRTESFSGPMEPRFGDGEVTTTSVTTAVATGDVDIPIYSVVNKDCTLAENGTPAYGITAAPLSLASGQKTTMPVYRTGHWSMDALNWHTSFTTDLQKQTAFEDGKSPTMFVSKKDVNADAINI